MNHWIQYKFRFNDDPLNPDWWMDLFLIDTAFRDIIEKYDPPIWRFHRRSGKDGVGHQLSLLVYTDDIRSPKIYTDLGKHHSVGLLEENHKLKSISIEVMQPGIEKTSDANWSEDIQKYWPFFIHGSCQMILGLMRDIPKYKKPILDTVYEIYSDQNERFKNVFTDNAAHVFIHHISALFGYPPITLQI